MGLPGPFLMWKDFPALIPLQDGLSKWVRALALRPAQSGGPDTRDLRVPGPGLSAVGPSHPDSHQPCKVGLLSSSFPRMLREIKSLVEGHAARTLMHQGSQKSKEDKWIVPSCPVVREGRTSTLVFRVPAEDQIC